MAYDDGHKSSAELQREIEMQRSRVESTIDQIQQKLSPGQMVDELLSYTKGGGGEFVSSLQRNITANPLPVALLGVSLAWLMAKPASAQNNVSGDRAWDSSINRNRGYDADDYDYDDADYPIATISGSSLQHLGTVSDQHGNRFSEFADDAGKKWKAATDATGRRAGHFVDETGKTFRGFTDSAGNTVSHFRDEAGNLLDEVSGWASHTWRKAREKLHDARDSVQSGVSSGRSGVGSAASSVQSQVSSLNETILTQFRDQPLVGGALAFALGAALGSALPRTEQEDAILGEAADKVKDKVTEQAADLYEQGKEKASELYGTAAERAGQIYQETKEGFSSAASNKPH
jgi:gas vesicle protein